MNSNSVKRYDPSRGKPSKLAGLLLYILPLPLLLAAIVRLFGDSWMRALILAVGFCLCMLAATMIRRGLTIEAEATRRRIARRASTIPYKMTGAIVLGVAMFLVAIMGVGHSLLTSLVFGATAFLGSYLYYGFDPSRKNPDLAAVGITSEEVIDLIEEAETRIESIEDSRKSIKNPEFRDRLRNITIGAREILDTIEDDPNDARKARKFLKVYLDGAEQVTEGYARIHKGEDSPELEDNFRRVLGTIETVMAEQKQKLSENNLTELDVQIEVLQLQLEKEGIG